MFSISDDQPFDLVIIGGGITGAALAYLATQATPALHVALLEAGDLASGTSGRSSRFLHGGLRYLAQGRVGLVRRLLRGRAELAGLVPHLVRPAPFILPFGPGTPHAPWMLRAALRAYGVLERGAPRVAGIPAAGVLAAADVRRLEPLLASLAPQGALTYGELTVDDAALVRALAQAAHAAGATVRTHCRCDGPARDDRGRVVGVVARSGQGGDRVLVRGRVVVDARGPWAGVWNGHALGRESDHRQPRGGVRLARGTHIVLPAAAFPLSHTVVFFAAGDRRPLFASPRGRHVVIGTTDVPHTGTPDHVVPTRGEVAYLMESLAQALPGVRLARDAEVTAFAGVRALVANDGGGAASAGTATLDRDYAVAWEGPGLLVVRGGKLTLGLDGARRALRALRTERRALGLPDIAVPAVGMLPRPLPAPSPVALASAVGAAAPRGRAVSAVSVPSSSTGRAA